jgi:rubrerythrin
MKLFSSKTTYSHHISNIIRAYTGKQISNNTIRKIWETALISSPEYQQMTNKEKTKAHGKLLHSASTANEAYNKIRSQHAGINADTSEKYHKIHKRLKQMKICKCCGQVIK